MNCKNLIAICGKTHLPCPYAGVAGHCEEAECLNAVVPTWEELLDIYEAACHPTRARMYVMRSAIKAITAALGVGLDAKVTVTDEQIDSAYAVLLGRYNQNSVREFFNAVKACTSERREVKIEYRKRGKNRPDIDLPNVEKVIAAPYRMNEAQHIALKCEIFRLREYALAHPKDRTARARFLWVWLQYTFGMRPADCGVVMWGIFVTRSNGSMWLDFIPTKTARIGKRAGCRLTDQMIEEIRPFIGRPDEYVIPRMTERTPKGGHVTRKHGEYEGHHRSLREWLNGLMHQIGVDVRNAEYALRKDCSQRMIKEHGVLHEAQMLGHSPQIAMKHYTDISQLELKEGL